MLIAEHLLRIEAPIERAVLLEQLWAGHAGSLAGTSMLKHADALAQLYWKEKDYAGAEPVLEALWAVRATDIQVPANMRTAEKQARLATWFITGYRYGNPLTKVRRDVQTTTAQLRQEFYPSAKAIFQQLWAERAKLPRSVAADVTIFKLADGYAGMLLYFGYNNRAEEVAGTAWQIATPANSEGRINEDILQVGNRYARALWKNADGKTEEAQENSKKSKDIYKLLFNAWKELSRDRPQNQVLAKSTINCGYSLLNILEARNRAPYQCKRLEAELEKLESAARQQKEALRISHESQMGISYKATSIPHSIRRG
jgi:hypothetical protein